MSITIDGTTGISGNNGSASTPAIQGEDTNTGVFFPAADIVAVATAGAERVRVDANGSVGISITSPAARLDVSGASGGIVYVRGTGDAYQEIAGGGRTPGMGSVLVGQGNSGEGYLWNRLNSFLSFGTNATERARITSGGDFQFNSGFGSVSTVYGCRAWVNFNGTNGAIRASGNVSSVTYNGTGQSTVNFTTAMPDVNYSAVCSGHSAGFNRQANAMPSSAGYATGSIVILYGNTINGAAENLSHVNVAVFR